MRQALCACGATPRVDANLPPIEQIPVLRRSLPVDSGGLLKATTSAKTNRNDQALLRNATVSRERADDVDLLQVTPAHLCCLCQASSQLPSHCKSGLIYDRCI